MKSVPEFENTVIKNNCDIMGEYNQQQEEFENVQLTKTGPDTRLPQSHADGQGQCWRRSLEHSGRSSKLKKLEKVKGDQPTNRPTQQGVESRSTRLRIVTAYEMSHNICQFLFKL